MKSVGIITFHASHNYGSMLEAYALQQTVIRLGHECEIINFRTERQKNFYQPFYLSKGFRPKIKALVFPKLAWNDRRKYSLFERFMRDKMILSECEYHTEEELLSAYLDYDAYISGSDQIWNTSCFDFDWSYFLDFVVKGRKIAYAPSMGPDPEHQIQPGNYAKIAKCLEDYDAISVREERTLRFIKKIGVNAALSVSLDPTLLLERSDWDNIISEKPIIKGEYVFLYTPWYNEDVYKAAERFAESMDLRVVVTKSEYPFKCYNNKRFIYYNCVGPLEFINLIKNSAIIVTSSFHAVVFSLIYNKSFIILDGIKDSRICNLFQLVGLDVKSNYSYDSLRINSSDTIGFDTQIIPLRNDSLKFLKEALS